MKIVSQSSQENPEVNLVVFQKISLGVRPRFPCWTFSRTQAIIYPELSLLIPHNFLQNCRSVFQRFQLKISLMLPMFTFEIPYMISPESPTKILR